MLLGPNTGLGHSFMLYMIESQVDHVLGAIAAMDGAGATVIEVRDEIQQKYNRDVDGRMQEPCGRPVAARASTSTGTVAMPRFGPAGSGGFANFLADHRHVPIA
jgi:hypothetical protein